MKIPTSMQAAILTAQHQSLVVDDVQLPKELQVGQVLVRVLFSGICGSQIGEINGVKGPDRFLPHLLGHEGTGDVIACGPGVSYVAEGDRVVLHWRPSKGIQAQPPEYYWNGKPLNAGFVTTFNEYAIVSENRLTTIPKDINPRTGTLLGCAVTTGLGVISNNAKLTMGQSLVVFGAGGVGLNIIQGGMLVSAYPIVGIDLTPNKLEMAHRFGATHTINAACEPDILSAIRKALGSEHADVVIDNTGDPEVIHRAMQLTHQKGKTILVGVPKKGDHVSFNPLPLFFGKELTGSHGGECNPGEDIPRYLKLYRAGRLELDALVTHSFNLDRINVAISKMQKGEIAGRCVIQMPDMKESLRIW